MPHLRLAPFAAADLFVADLGSLPPKRFPIMTTNSPAHPTDVAIIGGGPAGLAAALALGRACRQVVLFDAGSPRNAAATHIHNFVTRDGTPPHEFRTIARQDLEIYESVTVREERVTSLAGQRDAFELTHDTGVLYARRVILCCGMVDEMLDIPGFREAWGHSIFQCPYCHGWEMRNRRWGFLALNTDALVHGFPAMLTSWTDELVVFAGADLELEAEAKDDLNARGIEFEPGGVAKLVLDGTSLTHVELDDGRRVECHALFVHPPQRQVTLVQGLDLELDAAGYVKVDPMTRQTSLPGIYASGDLTSRAQGAVFAAATGTHAGAMCNHDLAMAGR